MGSSKQQAEQWPTRGRSERLSLAEPVCPAPGMPRPSPPPAKHSKSALRTASVATCEKRPWHGAMINGGMVPTAAPLPERCLDEELQSCVHKILEHSVRLKSTPPLLSGKLSVTKVPCTSSRFLCLRVLFSLRLAVAEAKLDRRVNSLVHVEARRRSTTTAAWAQLTVRVRKRALLQATLRSWQRETCLASSERQSAVSRQAHNATMTAVLRRRNAQLNRLAQPRRLLMRRAAFAAWRRQTAEVASRQALQLKASQRIQQAHQVQQHLHLSHQREAKELAKDCVRQTRRLRGLVTTTLSRQTDRALRLAAFQAWACGLRKSASRTRSQHARHWMLRALFAWAAAMRGSCGQDVATATDPVELFAEATVYQPWLALHAEPPEIGRTSPHEAGQGNFPASSPNRNCFDSVAKLLQCQHRTGHLYVAFTAWRCENLVERSASLEAVKDARAEECQDLERQLEASKAMQIAANEAAAAATGNMSALQATIQRHHDEMAEARFQRTSWVWRSLVARIVDCETQQAAVDGQRRLCQAAAAMRKRHCVQHQWMSLAAACLRGHLCHGHLEDFLVLGGHMRHQSSQLEHSLLALVDAERSKADRATSKVRIISTCQSCAGRGRIRRSMCLDCCGKGTVSTDG